MTLIAVQITQSYPTLKSVLSFSFPLRTKRVKILSIDQNLHAKEPQ